MLEASRSRIEALPEDAVVLDVGGWASPLPRADYVIDLLPWETRGLYAYPDESRAAERFTRETWVTADICAREPWPFADDQFDVVVCSHTLEDVRDPIGVCAEMSRVGKAGYVEVPSRLEEQIYGFQGPWVGWSHHRWLIDLVEDELIFLFKHHDIHAGSARSFPRRLRQALSPDERVIQVWWDGEVRARERVIHEPAEFHADLEDFVRRHAARVPPPPPPPPLATRIRRRLTGGRTPGAPPGRARVH